MKIAFGNMALEMNVFNIAKQPRDDDECYQTFFIDILIEEEVQLQSKYDNLEDFFQNFESFNSFELATFSAIFKDS